MIWETILDYIEDTDDQYWTKCYNFMWELEAHQVVFTAFKFSPSLTYLDLSSWELTRQWRAITSWEKWRKFLDKERKTIIYKLDLEDKNQFTRCSAFCSHDHSPMEREWTPDYEGFPGYSRYHRTCEVEKYDFSELQTLDKDIVEHLMKSNNKEILIRRWLPVIDRLKEWIGPKQTGSLYAFFLKTLFEMKTRNIFLIDTLLAHSKSSTIWTNLDICYVKAALSTSKVLQVFHSDLFFKGSCGHIFELLMHDEFSKIKMFIHYGLYPLNEDCFDLNKNSENSRERFYFSSLEIFFQAIFPLNFSKYETISDEFHLTSKDLLILIALYIHHIKPKGQDVLIILWRCISNAFLTYDDFQHFFAPELPAEETETLNSRYLWYKGIVGADGTRSQPRDLKHYCRCVLRQKLRECSKLPNGIEALPLPCFLKSYLRLEH